MLTLPSLWNLIISTLVFFVAVRYLHRYLEERGLPKGMTRGTLVFVLASLVSWGSGEAVDWTQQKIEGPQPEAQTSVELMQLLKAAGLEQPVAAALKELGSK